MYLHKLLLCLSFLGHLFMQMFSGKRLNWLVIIHCVKLRLPLKPLYPHTNSQTRGKFQDQHLFGWEALSQSQKRIVVFVTSLQATSENQHHFWCCNVMHSRVMCRAKQRNCLKLYSYFSKKFHSKGIIILDPVYAHFEGLTVGLQTFVAVRSGWSTHRDKRNIWLTDWVTWLMT